jgi:hypothetical protein
MTTGPAPSTSLSDALDAWTAHAGGASTVLWRDETTAVASRTTAGRVVEIGRLRTWDGTGGWYVESGRRCRGR